MTDNDYDYEVELFRVWVDSVETTQSTPQGISRPRMEQLVCAYRQAHRHIEVQRRIVKIHVAPWEPYEYVTPPPPGSVQRHEEMAR